MKLRDRWQQFTAPFHRRKDNRLIVLYASAHPLQDVFDVLKSHPDVLVYEALSAEGLIRGTTRQTDMIICDGPESVLTSSECPADSLVATLKDLKIPIFVQEDFLQNPEEAFGRAMLARGDRVGLQHLATRFVLVTGFVGGVGKTTLSMALARRFREARRPAALLEASAGRSTLASRTRTKSTLYDAFTQPHIVMDAWEGVDIYPAAEGQGNLLASEKESDRRAQFFDHLHRAYSLVVWDAQPRHPLWPYLLAQATDVLIVATPAAEHMEQAEEMIIELRNANVSARLHQVINKVQSAGELLAFADALHIPFHARRAQRYDSTLADPILDVLYPGWHRVRRSVPAARVPAKAEAK
jgi:hypothetical protein